MHELTVAVFGRHFSYYLAPGPVSPAGVPYTERPQVRVTAESHEALADVLNRAAENLGYMIREPAADEESQDWPKRPVDAINFVDFYDGTDVATPWTHLTVVDDQGRAVWGQRWQRVTIAQLLESSSAGLIDGDVLRPYFMPQESAGDFGGIDWAAVLDVIEQVPDWLKALSDYTGEATTLGGLVLGGRLVFKKRYKEWRLRRGGPLDVAELAKTKARKPAEVARLLGIEQDEAEAIMKLVGRRSEPGAAWAEDMTDDLGQAVWTVLEAALRSGLTDPRLYPRELLYEAAQDALRYVLEGGRHPVEIQAIFGRRLNPNWDEINAHLWKPPE